ncbi:hypothetical protein STEG23_022064 [Scotinomys teguina]
MEVGDIQSNSLEVIGRWITGADFCHPGHMKCQLRSSIVCSLKALPGTERLGIPGEDEALYLHAQIGDSVESRPKEELMNQRLTERTVPWSGLKEHPSLDLGHARGRKIASFVVFGVVG